MQFITHKTGTLKSVIKVLIKYKKQKYSVLRSTEAPDAVEMLSAQ